MQWDFSKMFGKQFWNRFPRFLKWKSIGANIFSSFPVIKSAERLTKNWSNYLPLFTAACSLWQWEIKWRKGKKKITKMKIKIFLKILTSSNCCNKQVEAKKKNVLGDIQEKEFRLILLPRAVPIILLWMSQFTLLNASNVCQ